MLKSFGRSIWHFFARPAPTSVALMVGPMSNAANDDQAQLLRRAMRAASQPEEMAQTFETTFAEPKLTVVTAGPAVQASAAEEETEGARDTTIFEDDPEGGIDDEADDAALALTSEEERADAEEMDLAAPGEAPESEERLEAADETTDEDEAWDESGADDAEEAGGEAVVAEAAEGSGDIQAVAVAFDEPIEDVVRKVVQAPYVAALAELEDVVPDLEREGAPADSETAEANDEHFVAAAADEPAGAESDEATDEMPQDVLAAAVESIEGASADEPAEAALTEEEVEEAVAVAALEDGDDATVPKKTRKKRASSPRKKKSATKSASRKSKSNADVPVEPVPEDDVWVSDAVVWSLSGEWIDGEWHAPEDVDCPQRLEELCELAAEGKLTIWGRSEDAAVWQPIEPSYWKSGTVEPSSLAEGRENVVAEPKTQGKSKRKTARKYLALKVSKSQVEEIWQPGPMH